MKQLSDARIMLVDDNVQNIQVLASLLDTFSCELMICTSGFEALEALELDLPDLILLDVMMPELDGYEVCRRIRANPLWLELPIIFITAKSTSQDIILGFEVGGNDYVTKPYNEAELLARVRNQLELKRTRDTLVARNAEMEILIARLAVASATDALTGLLNRRAMTERFNEEIARFQRHKRPFAIAMADIDHFKRVNDTCGHDCGDKVLIRVAERLKQQLRQEDQVARWGGEEFLLLLTECGPDGAYALAERIRMSVAQSDITYDDKSLHISITLGLVSFEVGMTLEEAVRQADEALYAGKQKGRNQVYVYAAKK